MPYTLERTIHVPLDGEHPSSCNEVTTGLLAYINKVKDIIFQPALILGLLRLAKLLGVVSEVGSSGFFSCPIDPLGREGGLSGE